MTIRLGGFIFKCPLFLLVLYPLVLTLLLNLGFWQLNRADEKQQQINQQAQQLHAEPIRIGINSREEMEEKFRYRKAMARGSYDTKQQFLLDNQILNGKVGYFVLTPFVLEGSDKTLAGKKAILVNRGWVAANLDRRILPDVAIKTSPQILQGRIDYFPSVGITLEGAGTPTATSPAVVQVVDTKILAAQLGYSLLAFQMELDPQETEGYTRQWLTTTLMPPERHFGYALQWFGLALTLTILFFWYSIKKNDDSSTTTKP